MTKPRYATKAQVKRAIEAAREAGIDVGGYRLHRDGSIVIFDKSEPPKDDRLSEYV